MKIIHILSLLSLIFSCNSPEKKEPAEKSENEKTDTISEVKPAISDEDKCISLVDTLPEIFALRNDIEITTKNLNRMVIWVAADPSETKIKYYWLKVGEDNGDNIATLHNFYVDPKHDEVLYYDVVNDTLITLEEWRGKKLHPSGVTNFNQ